MLTRLYLCSSRARRRCPSVQAEYERSVERYKLEGEAIKEFRKKARTTPDDEGERVTAVKVVSAPTRRGKESKSAIVGLKAAIRKKQDTHNKDNHNDAGTAVDSAAQTGRPTAPATGSAGAASSISSGATTASLAAPTAGGLGGLVAYGSSDDDSDDNGA